MVGGSTLVKTIENEWQFFFGNPNTGVDHLDNNCRFGTTGGNGDRATLVIELDGVVNKVVDYLFELVFIDIHYQSRKGRGIVRELQVLFNDQRFESENDTVEQG